METLNHWDRDLPEMVDAVEADPPHIGVLSMGEQCAVALILDVVNSPALKGYNPKDHPFDLRPRGYTWLDCVDRIEPELLAACIRVQRARS